MSEPHVAGDLARAGALVLALVLFARAVLRLGVVVELAALGLVLAVVTLPVQRALAGRIGSPAATAATALGTFAAIVGAGALVLRDLAGQTARLADVLADGVRSWRPGTLPARAATALDVEQTIRSTLGRVAPAVVAGETTGLGVGRRVLDVVLVVVLAAFLQGGLPAARSWLLARWPRAERPPVHAWLDEATDRAGAVVRRSLLTVALGWSAIGALAAAAGVPGSAVLGAWAGTWLVVPAVGPLVALAPAVAAAASVSPATAVVVGVGGAAVALAVRRAVRRLVEQPAARIGAPGWVLALGIGSAVAGVAGALLGFALAATVAAVGATAAARPALPGTGRRWLDDLVRVDEGHVRLVTRWRGVGLAFGVVAAATVAWLAVRSLRPTAAWVAVGTLLAIALDRPVRALAARARLGRFAATSTVLAVAALAVVVVGALAVRGAASAGMSTDLATQLRGLDEVPVVGHWFARIDVADEVGRRVDAALEDLGTGGGLNALVTRAGATAVDVSWALLLAAALLYEGRRVAAAAAAQVPARHRRQVDRLGRVAVAAVAGYAGGAVLVAALNAGAVLVIALISGLALAPVLAAWAFVCNFLPQIGGFLGGMPLVVLALANGVGRGALAAALFLAYQFTENHVIQPALIGDAIQLPGWVTLLTVLAGGAAAGVIGAVVLTPLVGVIHQVLQAARRADFPGRTVASPDAPVPVATADP